jgi:hypothetical protein
LDRPRRLKLASPACRQGVPRPCPIGYNPARGGIRMTYHASTSTETDRSVLPAARRRTAVAVRVDPARRFRTRQRHRRAGGVSTGGVGQLAARCAAGVARARARPRRSPARS